MDDDARQAVSSVAPWTRLASPAVVIAIEAVRVRLPHAERLFAVYIAAVQVGRRRRDAEVGIGLIARVPPLARCGRREERDDPEAERNLFLHCSFSVAARLSAVQSASGPQSSI